MTTNSEIVQVLILAGGLGKRMNSDLPKILHKLHNKTLIQSVIETANSICNSPDKIGIIVGKYKDQIEKSINETVDKDIISKIEYIIQEEPKGTGHAVQCASEFISKSEKVLILSGDVPLIKKETLEKLLELYNKESNCNLLVAEMENPTGYGRIKQLENNKLSIIEEKDCTEEEKQIKIINGGIYCFDSKKLLEILPKLDCNNAQQEYYLTDTIKYLESVSTILVENNLEIQGVNTKEQLEELEKLNVNFLDFIEIGTSDFDCEILKIDNKVGISIEPIKYYLDRLSNKKNCIKLNIAISNYNGYININYLDENTINKYNLPIWARGCNSVNNFHNTIKNILLQNNINIKDLAIIESVPCYTLKYIINDNNITGIYLLKIDTEGHDCIILEHYFENYQNNNFLPHKIIFETNILTDSNYIDKILLMAKNIGYDLISRDEDAILQLNLKKIAKNNKFSSMITNYYIEEYPKNYDPNNLPHENTLEAAKKYCIKNNYSGITYENNKYEVRNGKYLNYYNDSNSTIYSWIYL